MKKSSRVIAFALALMMTVCAFATISAAFAAESEKTTPWDEAVNKLYGWGIIDEADVIASKDTEKKLDRHVFALWMARILAKEYGDNIWFEISKYEDKAQADEDGFATVYDDVNKYEGHLYRRAVEYVTANGLFEGYGVDPETLENNFGPVYKINPDGSSEGAVELYQACKVIIALLTRWSDETDTKYLDEVKEYQKYLGGNDLMSMGTAYIWKATGLGMIDSVYTNNCREYFWDAELNYGETAYILVKAIESVLPAGCADGDCKHGKDADSNGNGVIDCYIKDIMVSAEGSALLTGVITGPDAELDVLGNENVTVVIYVGGDSRVEVSFTAEEFKNMAITTDGKVDLTTGENGYEVNTVVSVKYYGDLSVIKKSADRLTEKEIAEIRAGILEASDGEVSIIPVSGYSVYDTYLVNVQGQTPVLSEKNKVTFDKETHKLTYRGVVYTIASSEDEVSGNKLVARINGLEISPEKFAEAFKNLAEGEVKLIFCDSVKEEGTAVYESVEVVSCRAFASLHVGLNDVRNNGKIYSYILYKKSIINSSASDISIMGNDANGLMIALFNDPADGKHYPFYKYVDIYSAANSTASFKTVKGIIEKVEMSEVEGYYEVTVSGKKILIPTADGLENAINTEFFYNVDGDWASATININTNYSNSNEYKSWFKDLESAYSIMKNDMEQLVAKQVEVVYSRTDGKAVYVSVESSNVAQEIFGTGYVSKVEKTDDDNIIKVTLNKVCAGGAMAAPQTFDIDVSLTASYNYSAEFVRSLLDMIVAPTSPNGIANADQLIFATVKTDGQGRYILTKSSEAIITFGDAHSSKVLGESVFVSSVVYGADGRVIASLAEGESYDLSTVKGSYMVTVRADYIAEKYGYVAIKDSEGNVTGYKLMATSVKEVCTKYISYADGTSSVESGDTYYCKMENGKWNIGGINDYSMEYNAEFTKTEFIVDGKTVISDISLYTVHFITPSANAETFEFSTKPVSECIGGLKIVEYAFDITSKTITIIGE